VHAGRRHALYAACVLCALNGAAAANTDTLTIRRVITACAQRLGPSPFHGLKNIEPVCPDLERALADSGFGDELDDSWRDTISAQGLRDLDRLTRRYEADEPMKRPSAEALRAATSRRRRRAPGGSDSRIG
jgi:hypothetical protein